MSRITDFIVLVCALSSVATALKFKVVKEWNYVNFTWPNNEIYSTAIAKGLYVPENNIVAGLKYFEDFYYVTLPRMKNGVPATLTRIPVEPPQDTAPLLAPFPSWEMNTVDDCNALQNVQNVEIDARGQIWIIDGGRIETLSPNPISNCPPKLVIFDIRRNMTTLTYTFPESVAMARGSFLYDIVVDDTDGGYAYITDNSGRDPGIIVFSVKDHHAWKLRHSQTMRADPNASSFRVNGVMISAPINIASIALGPKIQTSNDRVVINEDREVYYAPLSSLHLYSLNTSVLRNENFAMHNGEYQGEVKDYGLKGSQSVGMVMDNQGVLYYSLLGSSSIARWDSHTPFQSGQKIVARDERFLEWPNSFAFNTNGNLTVLVNKLNKFIYERLNIDEPNFRLVTADVGGKSYLYDAAYNYQNTNGRSLETTASTTERPQPNLMMGSDQDPYLVYNPNQEPTPSPEPTSDHDHNNHMVNDLMNHNMNGTADNGQMNHHDMNHDRMDNNMGHDRMDHSQMDHDHMDHDHMDHVDSTTTRNPEGRKLGSGSRNIAASLGSVLLAAVMFVI